MIKAYITLIISLAIAAVAGWFSITGLVAILAGAPLGAIAMGVVIESGKLAGVSYLYNNWHDKDWFRLPLLGATLAAMLITSIGIYGYLGRAHGEQRGPIESSRAQVELIDSRIERHQQVIDRQETLILRLDKELKGLDDQIDVLVQYNKINGVEGSRATRESQMPARDRISSSSAQAYLKIDSANESISDLRSERIEATQITRDYDVEVSGIRSLAALLGQEDEDKVVLYFFALLMCAFDPLAMLLLIAANKSLNEITVIHNTERGLIAVGEKIQSTNDAETVDISVPTERFNLDKVKETPKQKMKTNPIPQKKGWANID